MDAFKTPGAFSWNELTTTDPASAAAFYGKLFGWTEIGRASCRERVYSSV